MDTSLEETRRKRKEEKKRKKEERKKNAKKKKTEVDPEVDPEYKRVLQIEKEFEASLFSAFSSCIVVSETGSFFYSESSNQESFQNEDDWSVDTSEKAVLERKKEALANKFAVIQ